MKVKSKISYLGEINSILPGQMAEQMAVEVDVKNVMHGAAVNSSTKQDKLHCFVWIFIFLFGKNLLTNSMNYMLNFGKYMGKR